MADTRKQQLFDAMVLLEMAFTEGDMERFGFSPDFKLDDLMRAAHDLIQNVHSDGESGLEESTRDILERLKIAHKIDEVRLYIPRFFESKEKSDRDNSDTRVSDGVLGELSIPIENGNLNGAIAKVNASIKDKKLDVVNIETIEQARLFGLGRVAVALRVWHQA